jgi:hypothetical protein
VSRRLRVPGQGLLARLLRGRNLRGREPEEVPGRLRRISALAQDFNRPYCKATRQRVAVR